MKIYGSDEPKNEPSKLMFLYFGRYVSSHRGQNTFTRLVLSLSLEPTGKTFYLSQRALGQLPNTP